jgi:hypothetical protein
MEEEAREVDEVYFGRRRVSYDFSKTFCVCLSWVANGIFIGLSWLYISIVGVV